MQKQAQFPADRTRRVDAIVSLHHQKLKPSVIRSMRRRLCQWNAPIDEGRLEESYNEAWIELRELLLVEDVESLGGLLVLIASCRYIDEARRLRHVRPSDDIEVTRAGWEDSVADSIDAKARVRDVLEAAYEVLTERELKAFVWCKVLTRPEVAKLMGMPHKRFERIMDGATLKLQGPLELIEKGEWCKAHLSMLLAFRRGWLKEGRRYKQLMFHLDGCALCSRELRELP